MMRTLLGPRRPILDYFTAALLALSCWQIARAQAPAAPQPSTGESTFTIFVRGVDVGREQVSVTRSGSQWLVTSTGRLGEVTINRLEIKYTADWQPIESHLELTQGGKDGAKRLQIATSFGVTTAINEITQNGVTNSKTDQISARTTVLPNNSFAGYEVLAAKLAAAKPGSEFPTYIPPNGEVRVTVRSIAAEDVTTPGGVVKTRKHELAVQDTNGVFPMVLTIDENQRLARLEVPTTALTIVRNDLAGVAVRTLAARNPTDSDVTIPANGFSIAGTLTKPPVLGRLKHPVIVLVGGSGHVDRDNVVARIPILSQLAGALSQQGYLVLRYDKRGIGQSGGRAEAATQLDYADDLIGIVKWLEKRDDVDSRRITLAGHGEGASIAMLAASREKKIDALVLIAATGTTGADLILEQQRRELDRLKLSDRERAEKIELQKQIQAAVVSGKGWESLPEDVRKQADSPWFRSLLLYDPAAVMPRIKQPILIIQGDLDTQVPPHHAEKLAELARARKKDAGGVEVIRLAGINHLLVRATTGDVEEYADLPDRTITPDVASTIDKWLKKSS
jgi:pimeloyl-ACP methyl ester carboxylesterase